MGGEIVLGAPHIPCGAQFSRLWSRSGDRHIAGLGVKLKWDNTDQSASRTLSPAPDAEVMWPSLQSTWRRVGQGAL